jgi:hypothetical protein
VSIVLPSARARICQVPFLFRAADCIDENGIFALSYGKRVSGVFARATPKAIVDQRGRLVRIPSGAILPSAGAGQPAVLLEPSSTNLCLRSEEFDAWGTVGSTTVTANATAAPDGRVTADLITCSAAGPASAARTQAVAFTGDGEKGVSIYLKVGNGAPTNILLQDDTAGITRRNVRVTWTDGVPSLTGVTGSGALYPVKALANGWYRVRISAASVVAANTNTLRLYVNNVSSGVTGDSVYAWGAQVENAAMPSSYIKTEGTTVTRSADALHFDVPALNPPRATSIYARFIEAGTRYSSVSSPRIVNISNSASADPRLILYGGSAGQIQAFHDNDVDASAVSVNTPAAARELGDVVEALATVSAAGAVSALARINGTESSGATSAAPASGFAAAWSDSRVYVNVSTGGGSSAGQAGYTHIAIADAVRTMDDLRALAGVG